MTQEHPMTEATPLASEQITQEALGDLPSRIQGWIGKARGHGRDRIELDFKTVELLVRVATRRSASPAPSGQGVGVALAAGSDVLNGRGNGTYDEACEAIRLLAASLSATSVPIGSHGIAPQRPDPRGIQCAACQKWVETTSGGYCFACIKGFKVPVLHASPAPSGALHDHVRKMQEACANYLEPTTYIARHPDTSKIGDCAWVREFPMPDQHASGQGAAETNARRDQAFIRDMIYMLDGPEQRAAMSAPAPSCAPGEVERHRCSICGGGTFTAVDVRQFNGTYAPGPERRCVECKTTFTAQAFAALSPQGLDAKEGGDAFRPMETWDQRDEAVLLLVDYADGEHPLDDARLAITVGHNNDHNVGDDEGQGWRFAGWCWSHDHYVEGKGEPVGWMPIPHILARAYAAFDGEPAVLDGEKK